MSTNRTRTRGEQGIAVLTTALCLLPLMAFAAFGVDLASWYSRISYLQKSADAASLAGTVWMPDLGEATTVACASLERNGITGGDCGAGPFDVTVERGSTSTALRVIVTDPNARQYFSQVFRGSQALTRSAEAEYNLPIPLGSPLNYFGGDDTTTNVTSVTFPTDWDSRQPLSYWIGLQGCNVGTSAAQGLGRWLNAGTFDANGFSGGDDQCVWGSQGAVAGGTSSAVPSDYRVRAPINGVGAFPAGDRPCNVFGISPPAPFIGRWTDGGTYQAQNNTSGAGNRQCVWDNYQTTSVPAYASTTAPSNQPCNVGWGNDGTWSGGVFTGGTRFTGMWDTGNNLCAWSSVIVTSNPIDPTRSPGFWAQIEGPQTISTNGDAYSPMCYTTQNCGSVENLQYEDPANVDRGYWYVVRMPAVDVGPIDINIFDASHFAGTFDTFAGDRVLGGGGSVEFATTYRVYQQNNPLDFTDRTGLGPGSGNETDGSCHWVVQPGTGSSFKGAWRTLCTLSGYTPGAFYLVNVQTTGSTGNGVNGYALEAVAAGGTQPAVCTYADMGMYNINRCFSAGCTPPPATFYLAEVGPQYAGKTLVVDLWDPGDVAGGTTATMYIKRPSPSLPQPVLDVPPGDCNYMSSPAPNPVQAGADPTGATYSTPQPSDDGTRCGVITSTGSRRFNGTWVTIRVSIPPDYDCDLNTPSTPINPEVDPNSCWWGIEYAFGGAGMPSANDVTVWQARIEGNPVHLTT